MEVAAKVPIPKGSYLEKTAEPTGKVDSGNRKVWKHRSPSYPVYMTWDDLHGEIEMFSINTLAHIRVCYPNGDYKSGPVKGRYLRFK